MNTPNVEFTYSPAIPYEPGVTRRDPSPIIRVGDVYYVWYSRTTESAGGYTALVWHATSPDGRTWTERGEAVGKGPVGAFDEHAVFTPTTLVAAGRYYLFYTAVPEPFTNDNGGPRGTKTAIGIATAESPDGPWTEFEGNPVLAPSDDPDAFDSMRVDDACLVVRDGRYWLYYKGRQLGRSWRETKMGLAIADEPTGPYIRAAENPLVDGGHEVCVWPHGRGVAGLFCDVGPEGNTLQYAADGIHFRRVARAEPPKAPGPFREDNYKDGAGPGIRWGLCMHDADWPYLERFDCRLSLDDWQPE